jgi:hypothetical protein
MDHSLTIQHSGQYCEDPLEALLQLLEDLITIVPIDSIYSEQDTYER